MDSTIKYYICQCMMGHVGKHNYIPMELPIKASSAKDASKIAMTKPRVKKNRKGVVLETREVSYTEFLNQCFKNNNNPYFQCHSIQEQRMPCNLDDYILYDDYYDEKSYESNKDSRFDRIKRKKRLEELKYGINRASKKNIYS